MDEQRQQFRSRKTASKTVLSTPAGVAAAPRQRIAPQERKSSLAATLAVQMGHLLDAIPDGVVIADDVGRMHLVNHQTETLFGYEREMLLGKPVEMLMPKRFRVAHPVHRAGYTAESHLRPMGAGLQLFGLRRDGIEFPVEISLSPIEVADTPLVLATIRDVSERLLLERRAHEAVEVRLSMLQAILDGLPVGVYLARGHDAELVLANRQVPHFWGAEWPDGQPMGAFLAASGSHVFDLHGRELAAGQLATLRALCGGQSVRQHEEVIRRGDGTSLSVLVNAIVLDPVLFPYLSRIDGHVSTDVQETAATEPLVLVVHQDISSLKDAERLKDEFIALAAHELRNPVSTLTVYAGMLTQSTRPLAHPLPPEWQDEAAHAVMESSRLLAALTDDLLDATRLQADRLILHPEPYEIGALVRRIVKRQQVTTTQHIITISTPEEAVIVEADVQRLEQALTNLLSNAIKYTPGGGLIEVTLSVHQVSAAPDPISGNAPTDIVRVAVRDHGIGIPASEQPRIFGRFARADNARQHGISGSGLGLYLSHELIERQGGRMWFNSVEGSGTTFLFELPRWIEPAGG